MAINPSDDLYKVSIDIGGTFTDVVAMRERDGFIQVLKVSSTPDDPSRAFLQGITELDKRLNIHPNNISCLIHGSTVGCNAVVQGKLPKVALITTKGFRDVLEIARMLRPTSYDLHFSKARLIVPRRLRFEIDERIDAKGKIVRVLTKDELDRVVSLVKHSGAEAVAVSCLFSFLNPQNERAIGEAIKKNIPDCRVCLSSDVNPIFREYERTCVTVLNAALVSVMSRYLQRIHDGLRELGCNAPLYIMRQDGGYMGSAIAQKIPVQAMVSGPTGGAVMANYLGHLTKKMDVVSLDVGGTTADVCMTTNGEIQISDNLEVGGYPLSIRSIEVNSVGAGGGSIAWVDKGGFLHVGPKSAGSYPGPIAYGLGGTNVTLTDANLVLGRLDTKSLLNGDMSLNTELAKEAVAKLADSVGMSTEGLAEGIIKIAVANMAKGIRVISVERGFDLRDFVLVPFGGGGPMYASEIARELAIPMAIIPNHPGVGSAFGLLIADLRHEASRSCVSIIGDKNSLNFEKLATELEDSVINTMAEEGHNSSAVTLSASGDFRYLGQSYDIPVPLKLPIDEEVLSDAVQQFHNLYEIRYGHCSRNHPVEIVNLHIAGKASVVQAKMEKISLGKGAALAVTGVRDIVFHGQHFKSNIYQRERLGAGDRIVGPAVICEYDSTTIIWPGDIMQVDEYGNLIITFPEKSH